MRQAILVVLLLTGCALWPLTEADCKGVNWQQRGYSDGFAGHPPQDLRLDRECRRYGVQVAQADYLKGWRDGYDEWYRLIGSMQRRGR